MNTNNNWKGIIEYNSLIPSVHSILHTNHLQQMNIRKDSASSSCYLCLYK